MLSKSILNKKINYHKYHTMWPTLEDMIEYFGTVDDGRLVYNGIRYVISNEHEQHGTKNHWKPFIRAYGDFENTTYYETFEELVEKHKFPDGKTILDFIFD